jgi:hypothetical protein
MFCFPNLILDKLYRNVVLGDLGRIVLFPIKNIRASQSTTMPKAVSSVPDSDESVVENSTAPTTPDGSLTFSPVLHAAHLIDVFDGAVSGSNIEPRVGRNLPTSLDLDESLPINAKNICCVGAGYVGKF